MEYCANLMCAFVLVCFGDGGVTSRIAQMVLVFGCVADVSSTDDDAGG